MTLPDLPDYPTTEPIPGTTYLADGWVYRDIPKMAPEWWDKLFEIIGEGNYVGLAVSDYGKSKRGQFLISPTGIANIAAYAKREEPSA